ncbi:hypothetical protein AXG93_411s1040 [Marchantia polymorpha subsp. ruderalis]|uniref:Uncharacterized protein n=1 Tax=Marchantia polymorpha subsp. ruderalis TaxID=1480154 RepID=A0A176VFH1_MARPO|nr:hypothetical protein AXG93_411s1040 [Marchantia polymorpha subsp. ruderalis]
MGSRVAGSSTSRSRREEKTRSTRPLTWRATVVKTKTHWIYRQNHWVLEFGHQRRRVRSKVARCDRRPPKKWTETAKRRDEESGPTKEGAKSYRSSSDGRTSWSARRDGPSGYLHVAALRQLRAQAGMEEGHGPGPAGACPKRFHMGAGTAFERIGDTLAVYGAGWTEGRTDDGPEPLPSDWPPQCRIPVVGAHAASDVRVAPRFEPGSLRWRKNPPPTERGHFRVPREDGWMDGWSMTEARDRGFSYRPDKACPLSFQ